MTKLLGYYCVNSIKSSLLVAEIRQFACKQNIFFLTEIGKFANNSLL